ncbi:hypothetical protein K493DRAFT_62607 [Basidiobolus meristosporus CBS 931.73]|uniref:C2H2-type domain-containing protein n=1 Tax=Basidiobolus meristosporus CBS 931.73 TaxID=1314790 RepID=A0A1Y1Z1A3_9FUNG|nr:hypothetical protein K493DRAFT_62607 [Basidiobolus meristosporus CBS 931.73]|eukprot:ORY03979.1 hypothetical protein K493DRAFT_62607 [Basidiobolus meristosporus CBS 931.73]
MQVADKVHPRQIPDTWYSCPFGNCSCKFRAYDLVKRHVLEHHMNTFSRCDSEYCETCLSHSQGGLPHVRSSSLSDHVKRKREPASPTATEKPPKYNRVRDPVATTQANKGQLHIQTDLGNSQAPNASTPMVTSPTLPSIRSIFNMDERPLPSLSSPGAHGQLVPSLPSLEELSFTSVTYSYNPWTTSSTIYPCQVLGCNMKFDRMEHLHRHLLYHPPEDPQAPGPTTDPRPPM